MLCVSNVSNGEGGAVITDNENVQQWSWGEDEVMRKQTVTVKSTLPNLPTHRNQKWKICLLAKLQDYNGSAHIHPFNSADYPCPTACGWMNRMPSHCLLSIHLQELELKSHNVRLEQLDWDVEWGACRHPAKNDVALLFPTNQNQQPRTRCLSFYLGSKREWYRWWRDFRTSWWCVWMIQDISSWERYRIW